MGDRINGTEGFGVMRAFGTVAALVALYGVSLSAAALIERPEETGAKRPQWFAPAATEVEQRPASPNGSTHSRSFWTSTGPALGPLPSIAAEGAVGSTSFWDQQTPRATHDRPELAGQLKPFSNRM